MTSSPTFEAFEPRIVVDEFARKIESLCLWKSKIIASLSDGSLLFFEEQITADAQDSTSAPTVSTWQVTRAQKGFTKRGAQQLQALEAQPFLLSLSDSGVQLHSLPECIQISAASRTAHSAAFAWDEPRQLLATAGRRKIMTHRLDRSASSLQEMTEYALPDNVLAVVWVGSNIVAATAKAYWLIVPAPPQSVEVLPGQLMTIYPTVAPQQLFGAGQTGPPLMARVGAEEVLVTKDSVSFFLGADGKPCRKTSIHWSQPPRCLVATPMYAIALLPSAVEVKGISRAAAATAEQMLLLPNMAVAAPSPSPDGCIYIASGGDGGIRQLRPLPLERQAKLLAAAGDFQGALELLTVLEDQETAEQHLGESNSQLGGGEQSGGAGISTSMSATRRQQLEDVLRLRFGYHLFGAGDYDEALTQLSMCSDPDPLLLLRLYPQLVPEKFIPLLPTTAYGEPVPELKQQQQQQQQEGEGEGAAAASSGTGSLAKQPAAAAASTAAVSIVVPYLLSHRTRLLGSLEGAAAAVTAGSNGSSSRHRQQQHDDDSSSSDGGGNHADSSSSSSTPKSQQELRLLATVIDTAIQRAMLLQPDTGALLRLLQQVNFVDLEDGEAALTSYGRYAELAALYQYHKKHERGLRLLQQLSQDPGSLAVAPAGAAADLKGLPGVWAAVRYLVSVRPQDVTLLQSHAGWILQADPEAGLELLLNMDPPLQYTFVLPLLEAHAHGYTAVYLESALELGLVSPQEVHSELLLIYLHMALEEEREGEASSVAHARQLSLSDLLVSRPHELLKLFPDDHKLWSAPRQRQQQQQRRAAAGSSGAAAPMGGTPTKPRSAKSLAQAAEEPSTAAAGAADEDAADSSSSSDTAAAAAPKYDTSTLAAPHHPHHRRDAYQRLRELVYASPYIDPDYVLSKLQKGQLLEIRALMLERLGRHKEALSVYVHDLHSMKLAEQYCDRVYEAGVAATAAAAPTSSAAAAAAAAVAAAAAEPPAAGVQGAAGGWGSRRPGELHPPEGVSSSSTQGGPKWDKVQLVRQQQQRQQQGVRRGFGVGVEGSKPSWSALPFGGKPQDIYMELVDAVLQGPSSSGNGSKDNSSSFSPPSKGAKGGKQRHRQQQQQQQQQHGGASVDVASWKALSELLARKNDRINHLQVLEELPSDLSLADVSPLLCSMLLHNTEQSRNSDVVLHLRRAENLMAREEVVKVKQRVVTLTFDRACCICHKRMGGAVSVAYPNGSLAHYLCHKRSTQQQQGKGGSSAGSSSEQQQGNGAWAGDALQGLLQQQQQQQQGPDWGSLLAAVQQ